MAKTGVTSLPPGLRVSATSRLAWHLIDAELDNAYAAQAVTFTPLRVPALWLCAYCGGRRTGERCVGCGAPRV